MSNYESDNFSLSYVTIIMILSELRNERKYVTHLFSFFVKYARSRFEKNCR